MVISRAGENVPVLQLNQPMATFTIQLQGLRFFARHGLYEEEQSVGNEFEVNLSMDVAAPKEKPVSLDDSINYAEVHRLVKEVMMKQEALLETLAMTIAANVKEHFPSLKKISVQIIKVHPPITAFTGSVGVTYNKKYKD